MRDHLDVHDKTVHKAIANSRAVPCAVFIEDHYTDYLTYPDLSHPVPVTLTVRWHRNYCAFLNYGTHVGTCASFRMASRAGKDFLASRGRCNSAPLIPGIC
jgi:hypothetical protein